MEASSHRWSKKREKTKDNDQNKELFLSSTGGNFHTNL